MLWFCIGAAFTVSAAAIAVGPRLLAPEPCPSVQLCRGCEEETGCPCAFCAPEYLCEAADAHRGD